MKDQIKSYLQGKEISLSACIDNAKRADAPSEAARLQERLDAYRNVLDFIDRLEEKAACPEPGPDFRLENHGSLYLVRPITGAGKTWLRETAPEDAQFLGRAMAVEPRYVEGVVQAAQNAGLSII